MTESAPVEAIEEEADHAESDGDRHLTMDTVDRGAVGEVARYVQLADIRSVMATAVVSPYFVFEKEVPASWGEHVVLGYDTHSIERDEAKAATLLVMASFFAHFDREWTNIDPDDVTAPPEDRRPDIQIEARFLLRYELSDDGELTDDQLGHFGFFNGTFNAWPYWREYAQEASMRLGLSPALVVPVFRVPRT